MNRTRLGNRRGMRELVIPVDADLAHDATQLLAEILQFLFRHELLSRQGNLASNPSRAKRRLSV